jgi:hypothetical protein
MVVMAPWTQPAPHCRLGCPLMDVRQQPALRPPRLSVDGSGDAKDKGGTSAGAGGFSQPPPSGLGEAVPTTVNRTCSNPPVGPNADGSTPLGPV